MILASIFILISVVALLGGFWYFRKLNHLQPQPTTSRGKITVSTTGMANHYTPSVDQYSFSGMYLYNLEKDGFMCSTGDGNFYVPETLTEYDYQRMIGIEDFRYNTSIEPLLHDREGLSKVIGMSPDLRFSRKLYALLNTSYITLNNCTAVYVSYDEKTDSYVVDWSRAHTPDWMQIDD